MGQLVTLVLITVTLLLRGFSVLCHKLLLFRNRQMGLGPHSSSSSPAMSKVSGVAFPKNAPGHLRIERVFVLFGGGYAYAKGNVFDRYAPRILTFGVWQ